MKNVVALLKWEILALKTSLNQIGALKDSVQKTEDAALVKSLVKETESGLSELLEIANEKEAFLKECKKENIEEFLEAQELQSEREVVMRLLVKVKSLEAELSKELNMTRELLKRSSAFVEFHINVMASVKADTTYGPPGQNRGDATAKKMFDANI